MSSNQDLYNELKKLKAQKNELTEQDYLNRLLDLKKRVKQSILNDMEVNYEQVNVLEAAKSILKMS